MNRWVALVPAAGLSSRLGQDKTLISWHGLPALTRVVQTLRAAGIPDVVVGVRAGTEDGVRERALRPYGLEATLVAGGDTRRDTVARCLAAAAPEATHALVHDAARPDCSPALVRRVMAAAERTGAATCGLPVVDTIHEVDAAGAICRTPARSRLWRAQTPQAFTVAALRAAHAGGGPATDDAGLVAAQGTVVEMVEGERTNDKLTFPEDLTAGAPPFSVGMGHDVHRLVADRPLILGGVRVPHPLGLAGHSDADALCHALCDATLGAAGLGDIGRHFPDTDPAWAGADSLQLLARCRQLAAEAGWRVVRGDCLVVAEAPRLAPHVPAMAANLARALDLPAGSINVKAGTNEGLGHLGRREGIAAWATVLAVRGPQPTP